MPNDQYTNSALSEAAAIHRPSGDHASECAMLIVVRARGDPPMSVFANTVSKATPASSFPSGDHVAE